MTLFRDYAQTDEFKRDVRAVVDDIVKTDLLPPIAEAIKELRAEVAAVKSRVGDELVTKVRVLELLVEALQAEQKGA
jgi:hypothetical protein